MAIGNELGAGAGMAPEVFYNNLTTRNDAKEGGIAHTISYAKTVSELIRRNTAEYEGFQLKKLPEYKKTPAHTDNYLTPATLYRRAFAEEYKVEQLVREYNALFDEYNELLSMARNRDDLLSSAVGKLQSFNQSSRKNVNFFDQRVLEQFAHDAKFNELVEQFKRTRLISPTTAQKPETPVDMLRTLYNQYEQERKRNSEEKKHFETVKKLMLEKQQQLQHTNAQLHKVLDNLKGDLDQAKSALSQHENRALATSEQHHEKLTEMTLTIARQQAHMKQTAKHCVQLSKDKDELLSQLQQETEQLAEVSRKATERGNALTEEIQRLERLTEQVKQEKILLEHQISQLETRQSESSEEAGSEIKLLESRVSAKDRELLKLRQDLSRLDHQVSQLERKSAEAAEQHKSAIRHFEDQVKSLNDELTKKKQELKASKEANATYIKRNNKLDEQLTSKQSELTRLEKQLKADTKELATLKAQEKSLKSRLDTANEAAASLSRMMDEKKIQAEGLNAKYSSQIQQLEKELDSQKSNVREKNIQVSRLQKEVEHLKAEATGAEKSSVRADAAVKKKEERITRLEAELNQAIERADSQQQALQQVNLELGRAKRASSAISAKQKEEDSLQKSRISQLQDNLQEVQKQLSEKEEKVKELQSQQAASQDLIRTLQNHNGELVLELSELDPAKAVRQTEPQESDPQTEQMIEGLQREVATLKDALALAYEELERSGASMQQNYQSMGYPSLSADFSNLRKENDELAAMYQRSSRKNTELNEQIAELRKDNQKLCEEVAAVNSGQQDANSGLERAKAEAAALKQEMRALQRDHRREIGELDEKLQQQVEKNAKANFEALRNASAVQDARRFEFAHGQLEKILTGLYGDLQELLTEAQFDELKAKYFTPVTEDAELVEESLPNLF